MGLLHIVCLAVSALTVASSDPNACPFKPSESFFEIFDLNNDGSISERELSYYFQAFQYDDDGEVSREELQRYFSYHHPSLVTCAGNLFDYFLLWPGMKLNDYRTILMRLDSDKNYVITKEDTMNNRLNWVCPCRR